MTFVMFWIHSNLFLNDPVSNNHNKVGTSTSSLLWLEEAMPTGKRDLQLLPMVLDLNAVALPAMTFKSISDDFHLSLVSPLFLDPNDARANVDSNQAGVHAIHIDKSRYNNITQLQISYSDVQGEHYLFKKQFLNKPLSEKQSVTLVINNELIKIKSPGLTLDDKTNEWLVDTTLNLDWSFAYLFGDVENFTQKVDDKSIIIDGARKLSTMAVNQTAINENQMKLEFAGPAAAYTHLFFEINEPSTFKSSFDDGKTWVEGRMARGIFDRNAMVFDVPINSNELLLDFAEAIPSDYMCELFVSHERHYPMFISSLEASTKNDVVNLNWIVPNNKYKNGFEIQRSTDRIEWKTLGYIPTALSNLADIQYAFEDYHPSDGQNYYRLLHKAAHNRVQQSEEIKLDFGAQQIDWQASVRHQTEKQIIPLAIQAKSACSFEISLRDRFGYTWQRHVEQYVKKGFTNMHLPLPKNIPSGTYYLHFNAQGNSKVKQVRI